MTGAGHWGGVVLDSTNPQRLARFWAAVMGCTIEDDSPGWVELRMPGGGWPLLVCQGINQHVQHGAATPQGNKFHLDVGFPVEVKPTRAQLEAEMARLEGLGARRVERIEAPGQPVHWIMADPEGNVFCAPGV
jgi:Glyoxalase-like domain